MNERNDDFFADDFCWSFIRSYNCECSCYGAYPRETWVPSCECFWLYLSVISGFWMQFMYLSFGCSLKCGVFCSMNMVTRQMDAYPQVGGLKPMYIRTVLVLVAIKY